MSEGGLSNSDWILVGKKKNNLVKKTNDLFSKNTGNLINLNNCVDFVEIKNKWSKIEINGEPTQCCDNECINTNKPYGNCVKGNGYGNIINGEDIEYFNCLEGRKCFDKYFGVYTKNSFTKPQGCFKYSLYYFEVKCIFERELNSNKTYMNIGLQNLNTNKFIEYSSSRAVIINEGSESKLSPDLNNNDIFGCGIVYPPINKINEEFPYIFFTQNGKQIGKATLLDNFDSYKPFVWLRCCSVEANFGNDLEAKPFKYDISKIQFLKNFIENIL